MLSRRKFFSLLPLSALGFATGAEAEVSPAKKDEEPSMWVEVECQRPEHIFWKWNDGGGYTRIPEYDTPACMRHFKVLRVLAPVVCPKCGWAQDVSRPGLREKFMGIPC